MVCSPMKGASENAQLQISRGVLKPDLVFKCLWWAKKIQMYKGVLGAAYSVSVCAVYFACYVIGFYIQCGLHLPAGFFILRTAKCDQ